MKSVVFQWAIIVGFGAATGVAIFLMLIDMLSWAGGIVVDMFL